MCQFNKWHTVLHKTADSGILIESSGIPPVLYVETTVGEYEGHNGDESLKRTIIGSSQCVNEILASGDELERCCAILGRQLPPRPVYIFLGDNAKEIARNWY